MFQRFQNKMVELMPHDKCLHFIMGFILALVVPHFVSDILTLIFIFIVALLKEIRDEIVYKGFDFKDIIFTLLPFILIEVNKLIGNG